MRTLEHAKEAKYKETRKKTAHLWAQSVHSQTRLRQKHELAFERWKRMSLEEDRVKEELEHLEDKMVKAQAEYLTNL